MSSDPLFELHPRLAADTWRLADWPLSQLLAMNDTQFPWCILVPRRANLREIYELDDADRAQLMRESMDLGRAMMQAFNGHKLNLGALGNLVPQLHLHHIVRVQTDVAWPAPVWGRQPALPYDAAGRSTFVARLSAHLTGAHRIG